MFLRCSGVPGGVEEGEEGTRVGDEVVEEGDKEVRSKSRSEIGGESKGRCVMRNRTSRKIALNGGRSKSTSVRETKN